MPLGENPYRTIENLQSDLAQKTLELERMHEACEKVYHRLSEKEKECEDIKKFLNDPEGYKKLSLCVEALEFCACLNMAPEFNLYAVNQKAKAALDKVKGGK